MVTREAPTNWRIILIKIPAEPSRHRVAVWRELRKIGALSIGQGVWAVPNVAAFSIGIDKATALIERAGGQIIFLDAAGSTAADSARFEAMFTAAREDDWTEFLSDCTKYEAELDKEIRIRKFTLAELEEEDQSLDRLRRWYRDLKARDVFGAGNSEQATAALQQCTQRFEDYSERVIDALHDPSSDEGDRP